MSQKMGDFGAGGQTSADFWTQDPADEDTCANDTEDCPGVDGAIEAERLPCWDCAREASDEQWRRIEEAI